MRALAAVFVLFLAAPAWAQDAPPPASPEASGGEVFEVVEQKPELIGGLEGLQRRVKYPEMARRAGIEGKVFIQFVVDETGAVIDAQPVRCPDALLCEAGLDAVRGSRFVPGRQEGVPVKVRFTLPIDFKLLGGDEAVVEDEIMLDFGEPENGDALPPPPPMSAGPPATPSQGLPFLLGMPWSPDLVAGGVGPFRSGTVKNGTGVLTYDDPNPQILRVLLFVQDGSTFAMEIHVVGAEAVEGLRATRAQLTQDLGPPGADGGFSPEQLGEPRRLFLSPETKMIRVEHAPLASQEAEKIEIIEIPRDAAPPPPSDEEEIYEVVETRPEMIGGIEAFQRRVVYPQEAREAGVEGRVFVRLVVEKDGRVTNAVCLQGPDLLCPPALAAVRATTFTPGMQRGEAVRVRFTIPVSFTLR